MTTKIRTTEKSDFFIIIFFLCVCSIEEFKSDSSFLFLYRDRKQNTIPLFFSSSPITCADFLAGGLRIPLWYLFLSPLFSFICFFYIHLRISIFYFCLVEFCCVTSNKNKSTKNSFLFIQT
jgi:hypothetical protein